MCQKILSFLLSIILCVLNFLGIPVNENITKKFEEVSYGPHERHTLNLYLPAGKEETGLVLMIHGGAWIGGDKAEFNAKLEEISEMGYAAAVSVALRALIYAFSFVARKLFEEKD